MFTICRGNGDLIHLPITCVYMQDIPLKVTKILTEKLGIAESEITPDANFVKDLGIDSLDYAEIVMEFEQTFDIRIPDDDAEKLQTFGQAVKYIQEKVNQ
jgi:acyl carrier protein